MENATGMSNVCQKHSSLAEVPFRCSFVILLLGKEKQFEVLTDPAKAVMSPTASLLFGEFGGSSSPSKGKYLQNHLKGSQSDYPGLSTKTQGSLSEVISLRKAGHKIRNDSLPRGFTSQQS